MKHIECAIEMQFRCASTARGGIRCASTKAICCADSVNWRNIIYNARKHVYRIRSQWKSLQKNNLICQSISLGFQKHMNIALESHFLFLPQTYSTNYSHRSPLWAKLISWYQSFPLLPSPCTATSLHRRCWGTETYKWSYKLRVYISNQSRAENATKENSIGRNMLSQ